jgi:predicted DNA binding protein
MQIDVCKGGIIITNKQLKALAEAANKGFFED